MEVEVWLVLPEPLLFPWQQVVVPVEKEDSQATTVLVPRILSGSQVGSVWPLVHGQLCPTDPVSTVRQETGHRWFRVVTW